MLFKTRARRTRIKFCFIFKPRMKKTKNPWDQRGIVRKHQHQVFQWRHLLDGTSITRTCVHLFSYRIYDFSTFFSYLSFFFSWEELELMKMLHELSWIYLCGFLSRSARSMAGSATPPYRSHLWTAKSGPSALGIDADSSSDDESALVLCKRSVSKPVPIPRSVSQRAT